MSVTTANWTTLFDPDDLRDKMSLVREGGYTLRITFNPPIPAALSANQEPEEGDVCAEVVEDFPCAFKTYQFSCPSCNTDHKAYLKADGQPTLVKCAMCFKVLTVNAVQ